MPELMMASLFGEREKKKDHPKSATVRRENVMTITHAK